VICLPFPLTNGIFGRK